MNAAVMRCRVSSKDHVPAARAALIAAGLVRSPISNLTERTTLLNQNQVTHPTQAYLLGRLLALCERTQRIEREFNVTIADRFYSSLSTRPATVFGSLMKLNRAHLSRMRSPGLRIWIEGRIAEVMSSLGTELPATLNLISQGEFALGYYHEKWADRRGAEPTPDITKGESN
jgi:CRISPR-associated protein Csd1